MDLRDRVVLLTGGKRIGSSVAVELARRGADIALELQPVSRTMRRRRRRRSERPDAGRWSGRPTWRTRRAVRGTGRRHRGSTRPARRAREHGVGLPLDSVRRDDRRASAGKPRRRSRRRRSSAPARPRPHMRASGGGRIMNFSDWLAVSARPRYKGFLAYYVAKKAVMGLTEGAGLGAGGRPDPRERDRARARSSRRPTCQSRSSRRSRRRRRSGDGAAGRKSPRRWRRSSRPTSSPAR